MAPPSPDGERPDPGRGDVRRAGGVVCCAGGGLSDGPGPHPHRSRHHRGALRLRGHGCWGWGSELGRRLLMAAPQSQHARPGDNRPPVLSGTCVAAGYLSRAGGECIRLSSGNAGKRLAFRAGAAADRTGEASNLSQMEPNAGRQALRVRVLPKATPQPPRGRQVSPHPLYRSVSAVALHVSAAPLVSSPR